MLRAAESAVRSAARWTLPFPVTAPPIAASASAAPIRIRPMPSTAGRAWPRRLASGERSGIRPLQAEQASENPAGDLGRATPGPNARQGAAGGDRRWRSRRDPGAQTPSPKLLDGERGQRPLRAAARRGRTHRRRASSPVPSAATQSRPGRWITASSAPDPSTAAATSLIDGSGPESAQVADVPPGRSRRGPHRAASPRPRAHRAPPAASLPSAAAAAPASSSRVAPPVTGAASTPIAAASPRLSRWSDPVTRIVVVIPPPSAAATRRRSSPRARRPARTAERAA